MPHAGAPELLRSRVLDAIGVPHAFTTRRGGVSSGIFSSLNFGNPSDLAPDRRDSVSNIRANLRLVSGAIEPRPGVPEREIVEVHQVHAAAVHTVRPSTPPHVDPSPKADAIVTDDPRRFAAVRTADCAPVLLASSDGRVVAAVHAGWRGVIAGVANNAVQRMIERGASDIVGAIGPCIGADHFEVGPEVRDEFDRVFGSGAAIVRPAPGCGEDKYLVDLKEALRRQLSSRGLRSIETLPHCTVRDADLFFSHRRERGMTGRMIGIIGPRAH